MYPDVDHRITYNGKNQNKKQSKCPLLVKDVMACMSKSILIVKKNELNLCVLKWKALQVILLNLKG